jgi:hypothetical protein
MPYGVVLLPDRRVHQRLAAYIADLDMSWSYFSWTVGGAIALSTAISWSTLGFLTRRPPKLDLDYRCLEPLAHALSAKSDEPPAASTPTDGVGLVRPTSVTYGNAKAPAHRRMCWFGPTWRRVAQVPAAAARRTPTPVGRAPKPSPRPAPCCHKAAARRSCPRRYVSRRPRRNTVVLLRPAGPCCPPSTVIDNGSYVNVLAPADMTSSAPACPSMELCAIGGYR